MLWKVSQRQSSYKSLTDCKRSQCGTKLTDEQCGQLCKELWSIGDFNLRRMYIAGLIQSVPKTTSNLRPNVSPSKRKNRLHTLKYKVIVEGSDVSVCKGCFMKIFNVSAKFIEVAVETKRNSSAGIMSCDARGKASKPLPDKKLEEVRNHLNSFPRYKSHYARNKTEKEFLPNTLTFKLMYEEYCSKVTNPVSRWTYEREIHNMGLKIKPLKIDTCKTCDAVQNSIMHCRRQEDRAELLKQQELHHRKAEIAINEKKHDKDLAEGDKSRRTIAFDLQQCLPTPYLNTSVVFYKRQLWVYNLTIHSCGEGTSVHNMWHEGEGERGANQVGSALYQYLMDLPDNVEQVTLWSDTCGGQNKNSVINCALITVMSRKKTLKMIDQKFLIPGHTHLECDTDHAVIEEKKKRADQIHIPRDWFSLVRNASSKFTVNRLTQDKQYDFKGLAKGRSSPLVKRKKDTSREKFIWKNVVWIQHRRSLPVGVIAFKQTLDRDAEFSFLDMRRKKSVPITLAPELAYTEPCKISQKKVDDLLSLLYLLDPECHAFYADLCGVDMEDFDPDLLPSSDEEESGAED